MVIIKGSQVFICDGAIVPEDEELEVIILALVKEHDRAARAHEGKIGSMPLWRVGDLIAVLEEYQRGR